MYDLRSLSSVRQMCKYHVVINPRYWQRERYGMMPAQIDKSLHELCRQHGVELPVGQAMPDRIHMFLSVSLKYRIATPSGL